jgi:hypothetical protein
LYWYPTSSQLAVAVVQALQQQDPAPAPPYTSPEIRRLLDCSERHRTTLMKKLTDRRGRISTDVTKVAWRVLRWVPPTDPASLTRALQPGEGTSASGALATVNTEDPDDLDAKPVWSQADIFKKCLGKAP